MHMHTHYCIKTDTEQTQCKLMLTAALTEGLGRSQILFRRIMQAIPYFPKSYAPKEIWLELDPLTQIGTFLIWR